MYPRKSEISEAVFLKVDAQRCWNTEDNAVLCTVNCTFYHICQTGSLPALFFL